LFRSVRAWQLHGRRSCWSGILWHCCVQATVQASRRADIENQADTKMSSERHIRHMKTLLLALALLLAAEPVLARNIIDWRCGDQWVTLEENKSTNPQK